MLDSSLSSFSSSLMHQAVKLLFPCILVFPRMNAVRKHSIKQTSLDVALCPLAVPYAADGVHAVRLLGAISTHCWLMPASLKLIASLQEHSVMEESPDSLLPLASSVFHLHFFFC